MVPSVARSNKDTDCTVPDVRQMTQEKFLELLKSGSGPSDGAGARSTVQNGRSGDKTGTSRGKGAQATDEVAENSGRWDAINDDYMIGKKVSLKVMELLFSIFCDSFFNIILFFFHKWCVMM